MCAPLLLAGGAIAASLAGTGVAIAGQVAAGKAAKYEADANEQLALAEAVQAKEDAELELYKHGVEARRAIGTQEALAAASNLDPTFGSAASILSDRYALSARDSITIMTNAARRATALRNSAAVYAARGANVSRASSLAAAGTGLQGAAQVLSFASSAKQAGVF